jgi:hypothetical protein
MNALRARLASMRFFLALLCSCFFALSLNGGKFYDVSGTITSGGTSQQLIADNSATGAEVRVYLFIQNKTATDHLYVRYGGAASASDSSSIDLPPGAVIWCDAAHGVPTNSVNIIGATTGDKFCCYYQ